MHPILFHAGAFVIPSYGVVTALGVLLALALTMRTARIAGLDSAKLWNLCVLSLFAAFVGARLLLIFVNWSAVRIHPRWILGLAMVHHPLLAAIGAIVALSCALWLVRRNKLPLRATADALAAPLSLGLAFEQLGALMVAAGYGTDASPNLPWAVTYSDPMAAIWSGAPLGVPLHPVQAYAALADLALAAALFAWLPRQRQSGETTGLWFMGTGIAIFSTEFWRDPAGRGVLLHGGLDGPQIAAIAMVMASAVLLWERRASSENSGAQERART